MADISREARALARTAAHGVLFTTVGDPDGIRVIDGAADAVLEAAAPVIARDVLLSLAADLDSAADRSVPHSPAAGAYRHAARMARRAAGTSEAATGRAGPGKAEDRQPGERTGRLSATERTSQGGTCEHCGLSRAQHERIGGCW